MSQSLLLNERDTRGVVRLTLNDPASFNALSEAMLEALQAQVDALHHDEGVRVLVLAATGKAFCAGHNLKHMISTPELDYYQALFAQCSRLMLSLQRLPVPVIARVQGLATAAGCQLVAQCDLALAASTAQFAVSGVSYGLFCATPSVPLLRNLNAKQAMEMLLTGEFISAEQARERGLINRVAAPEQLDEQLESMLLSVLAKPRVALAMGKELFYRQREMGVEAAYQLASQTMAVNMMDACAQEGVRAFTEKRAPSWRS